MTSITTPDGVTRRVLDVNHVKMVELLGTVEVPFFRPAGNFVTSHMEETLNVFNEPNGRTIYTSYGE